MPITIKNRWTDKPIATVENTDSLREAVIKLVNQGVDLAEADLRDAQLDLASLDGASLDRASLVGARLDPIRNDFFAVLSFAPAEVPALIAALNEGRVNGSCYSDGECGCLIGTLAIASGTDPHDKDGCEVVHGLNGNSERPAERFFMAIKRGHTPENSQFAKLARDWAQEWFDRIQAAFAGKAGASC